jgi:hypothetical protein
MRTTRWFFVILAVGLVSASIACSGESKVGEECDEAGKTEDVCESGSVCGKNTGDALVCLKTCTEQAQCGADQECNGVEGTNIKGCRTKSGTSGSSGGKK